MPHHVTHLPTEARSYHEWLSRLRAAEWPDLTLTVLGRVGPSSALRPLVALSRPSPTASTVALTAGIHGDEPGGVEALTQLLEHREEWSARLPYGLLIFPCANPSGYERGTRTNHEGIDLNRQFDRAEAPLEVALIRAGLQQGAGPGGYRASIEFHEDVDTDGFYLYELTAGDRTRLGESIIRAVGKHWPINLRTEIEGRPAKHGVIRLDAGQLERIHSDRWPQAIYASRYGTPTCLTFETPIAGFSLEQRAAIHLTALGAALDALTAA